MRERDVVGRDAFDLAGGLISRRRLRCRRGRRPARAGAARQPRQHGLEARFGIDQELPRCDDRIALAQPGEHFRIAADVVAERHRHRLQAAVAALHDHDRALAGGDHRLRRHEQAWRRLRVGDAYAHQHAGRQLQRCVVDLEPRLQRSAARADARQDLADATREVPRRIARERRVDLHPRLHVQRQRFGNLDEQPQRRQTGNPRERLPRRDHCAVAHVQLADDAGFRRGQYDVGLHAARAIETRDHAVRNRQRAHACARCVQQAAVHPAALQRQVFLLRCEPVRHVQRRDRRALVDALHRRPRVQAIDVARHARLHDVRARLIELGGADRIESAGRFLTADGHIADAEVLLQARIDPNARRAAAFVRIDGL